ncbi:MAG: terminase small subunit [Cyanobacteria bacterium SIG26]|nr:terminase small subunit [Cyanobacteria bacterium SIG26]MBQ7126209.1 terminase small subunit [bacterium]
MKQLTQQQKRFVSEYIRTLDGELSAQKAGYKCKDLKNFAAELLQKDYIIHAIKSQLHLQIESLSVQKGYVIQKLLQIAEFSLAEEDILDKDGNSTGKRKLRDSTAGLKALEALCKYLGFSNGQVDEEYQEAKIITISNLDDNKI